MEYEYSLDGGGMDGKPTRKGLYIHGGRKVAFRNYPFPSLFVFFYSFPAAMSQKVSTFVALFGESTARTGCTSA